LSICWDILWLNFKGLHCLCKIVSGVVAAVFITLTLNALAGIFIEADLTLLNSITGGEERIGTFRCTLSII
jgi:hypothetical protein